MNRHVLVSLLESMVFGNKVKVIPPNDDRPLHLHLHDNSLHDLASDPDVSSKRTLSIYVLSFDGFFRGLKSHTNVSAILLHKLLPFSSRQPTLLVLQDGLLGVNEDIGELLVCSVDLNVGHGWFLNSSGRNNCQGITRGKQSRLHFSRKRNQFLLRDCFFSAICSIVSSLRFLLRLNSLHTSFENHLPFIFYVIDVLVIKYPDSITEKRLWDKASQFTH